VCKCSARNIPCASGSIPTKLHRLCLDAVRRGCRHPGAKRPGLGRLDRRPTHGTGTGINATVTAQSQLQTPEQFRNIILKTDPSGRAGAVARRGAGGNWARKIIPSKASSTAGLLRAPPSRWRRAQTHFAPWDAVKARADAMRSQLPPGMQLSYPIDNTDYIRLSIRQVVETLIEAIGLVVLVMYIFLQNWRTTMVPTVAVPVVLLGTFGHPGGLPLHHQHAHFVRTGAGDRASGG